MCCLCALDTDIVRVCFDDISITNCSPVIKASLHAQVLMLAYQLPFENNRISAIFIVPVRVINLSRILLMRSLIESSACLCITKIIHVMACYSRPYTLDKNIVIAKALMTH